MTAPLGRGPDTPGSARRPGPFRILYLADTRFPIERANGIQTFETCRALAARGHRVHLLVRADTHVPPRDPFAFYGAQRLEPFEVQAVSLRGPALLRRGSYLAWALELASRRDADLVFTRDLGVAAAVLRLPRALRPPVVYESHGHAAVVGAAMGTLISTGRAASSRKQRRLARRERFVWRAAEGYVTLTSALAEELRGAHGARPALAVVADGTRAPEPYAPPAPGPLRVAYAGHLYPWKGVDTLVRALALTTDITATIVGGHPGENDLARVLTLAGELGLPPRITFTGLVPPGEVAARLRSAHVLVLPNSATAISSAYTSPLKLFEYLAAGRPIVASDLPAFREVISERQAVLVAADDPAAFAGALCLLRDDEPARRRMGEAAFALAAGYTWNARATRLEALFQEIA